MGKVIIFSDIYLPTFPYLEVPLYNELKDRGISTIYVLQDNDIRITNSDLSKIFFGLNLQIIKSPKQIISLIDNDDIFVMRFAYKGLGGDIASTVRSAKRKILMYDPSGVDIRFRQSVSQYLTSKSETLKRLTLKKFKYKHIFVTGTIHCDAVATTTVDRDEFMASYGMDPKKRFSIVTPANPAEVGHQHGISNEYTHIVNIVKDKCKDYEIAVKAHPMDYIAHMNPQPGLINKNQHYKGKHSWEVFAPDVKVIKADEGYKAIKACDVILNVRSSIAMETALFRKPLININRKKYTTNWSFDSNVMMDIDIGELDTVLNTNIYSIDESACLNYCKRENFSDDGKAYVRTADTIEKILNGEC